MLIALLLAMSTLAEGPRSFVQRVYSGYARHDYNPLDRPERIFSPELSAAIRNDARLANGEVGFLDGDPLCDCQDFLKIRADVMSLSRLTARSARARVRVSLGIDRPRELRLKLVMTKSGWRIGDIGSASEPSLLRALQGANRKEEARQHR